MLWQNQDQISQSAVANSAPDLPTTFGETFNAAWSRNNLFGQNYFGESDRLDALGDYLKTIQQKTGTDLAPELDYGTFGGGMMPDATSLFRQANDKLAGLKQKNPTLDIAPMTPEQFEQSAVDKRRKADADYEATMDRPRGAGATLGAAAGGVLASAADPINIAALPVAPAENLSFLMNALRWGAIGAGTQAASTAIQAPYREEVEPGYLASGAPIAEVAQGGLFTAAGGAAFRTAANVWERMATGAWPRSVKDAGNVVSSQANINGSNVYPGAAGAAAHEQALVKTIDDVLARQPVDVSKHITPELEASVAAQQAPAETARLDAQAATAAAERPVPTVPAPELPFERTALEAAAEDKKQKLILDVYDAAREGGYDDIPMADAGRIADKLIDATPEEAQKIFRDLRMSPRQVADAPEKLEPPAEPVPTPVAPIEDIHAPDFQDNVRADLDRELAAPALAQPAEPRTMKEIDAGPAPSRLPEQHDLYFKIDDNTRFVPIEDLISSKTPEENMKGAANGQKRMAAAAAGEIGRRKPITVRALGDGKYLVLDGNGTMSSVKPFGWKALPVHVVDEKGQVISDRGMPSLSASLTEAGREAPGINSSGVTEPLAGIQPTSGFQTSMRPTPLGSLIQRATTPSVEIGPAMRFTEFRLGDIDGTSKKNIIQGTNDYKALLERAAQNKPIVDDTLQRLSDQVPHTEYHGSRPKDLSGLEDKIRAKGRAPNTISDYLGARIIADTPDALSEVAQRLHDTGAVLEDEDFLDKPKFGYRARHMQLALDDGTSVEIQLVPRPIADVQDEAHAMRQSAKRTLDETDRDQSANATMSKAQKIFDDNWNKASGWIEGRPPEHIAGVAIRDRDTGKIYAEANRMHVDMYDRAAKDLGMRYEDAYNARTKAGSKPRFDEGFTTDSGRFVSRREAALIAERGEQILKSVTDNRGIYKYHGFDLDAGHLKELSIPNPAIPNGVASYSPYELGVDADRFQFKGGGDEAGVTDRLKGVKKWDPVLAGMSLVWIDKAGKPWIVDGHQRLGLARRIAGEDPAQNPQILARVLREDQGITPADARTAAALKNIAEGTGTAVDAAKVIRDNPERIDDLPPRSELVRQARGLATLSDDAFKMVVNDVVPPNYAAIVGRLVPGDGELQGALLRLLAKTDPANAVQAEAIARQGIEAGIAKKEAGAQGALFGDQEVAESLFTERAKVLDRALKTLRKDKTVFNTLVKEAETVEGAGNVLAKDINEQRANADGQAVQILQTLANRAGPISDALRTAAQQAKSEGGYANATRQFVATVRDAVSSGELVRLANGLERGATHVGDETTAGTIDAGLAAERGEPSRIDAADRQITDALEQGKLPPPHMMEYRETRPGRPDVTGTIRIPSHEEQVMRASLYAEPEAGEFRGPLHREVHPGAEAQAAYQQGAMDYVAGVGDRSFPHDDLKAAWDRGRSDAMTAARGAAPAPTTALGVPGPDWLHKLVYEPGAEGKPQAIMPNMEPSARQLAAARAGPLRAQVAQDEPGELFGPRPEKIPDMFMDAAGHPIDLRGAMAEIDGMKLAAEQLAACGAPAEGVPA